MDKQPFNRPPYGTPADRAANHWEQSISSDEFINHIRGKDLDDLTVGSKEVVPGVNMRQFTFGASEKFRYVKDPGGPTNRSRLIDMNHFLATYAQGPLGEVLGAAMEVLQKTQGSSSAFNEEDFLSNRLGQDFYWKHGDDIESGKISLEAALKSYFDERAAGYHKYYPSEPTNPSQESTKSSRTTTAGSYLAAELALMNPEVNNANSATLNAAQALQKFGEPTDNGGLALTLGDIQVSFDSQKQSLDIFQIQDGEPILSVIDGRVAFANVDPFLSELLEQVALFDPPEIVQDSSAQITLG